MSITQDDMAFTVWAIVNRPQAEVFEAVADPDKLASHFVMAGASGRMETGATVTWEFADLPGAFDVEVAEAEAPDRLVFHWPRENGHGANSVTFRFEPEGTDRCKVSVTEEGWEPTADDLKAAYGNCMGWTHMLASLKAWIEHGIVLREGMFR